MGSSKISQFVSKPIFIVTIAALVIAAFLYQTEFRYTVKEVKYYNRNFIVKVDKLLGREYMLTPDPDQINWTWNRIDLKLPPKPITIDDYIKSKTDQHPVKLPPIPPGYEEVH